MSDESSKPFVVETVPSVRNGISALASANASFTYFDASSYYGVINGTGQITLEAARIFGADADGTPIIDRVVVAHLRGNIQAIRNLKTAVDGILAMVEPRQEGLSN
jgi:hypothetical protein